MKRVLSLVLALVLVLGMIPTFAAEKTGGEELKALGLLSGNENGDLMEDQTLERQEFAKVIAQLNGALDEAAAYVTPGTYADFDKVEGWAKPYVAYAEEQGWMTGKTGNMFDPAAELKSQELLVVLLRVLGYDDTWSKVFETAAEVGLVAEEITAITRGDAFELIWTAVSEVKMADSDMTLGVHLGVLEPVVVVTDLAIESVKATNLKEVVVTFNQELDKDTVVAENFVLNKGLTSSATLLEDGKTVVVAITPVASGEMGNQVDYTLTVEKVKSVSGKELAKVTSPFTAFDATLPTVVGVKYTGPKNFEIEFSEPMQIAPTVTVKAGNSTLSVNAAGMTGLGTNVITVPLFSTLTDATTYTINVTGAQDFAGYVNVIKSIEAPYAKDVTAPTASIVKATQEYVVVEFSKPVSGLDAGLFSHTFSAWKASKLTATDSYAASAVTSGTKFYVWFNGSGNAAVDRPIAQGTTTLNILPKSSSPAAEILDLWGNKFVEATLPLTVVADTTAPEVKEVKITAETQLTVEFTKNVSFAAANIEILDKDGKAITGVTPSVVEASGIKKYTVNFGKNLAGENIIVNIKNVKDTTLMTNAMAPYSINLSVTDKTAPTIEKVTYDATDKYLYVFFSENMDSASTLVKDNFQFVNGTTYTKLATDPVFVNGSKTVRFTLNTTQQALVTLTSTKVLVDNAKDVAGNAITVKLSSAIVAHAGAVIPTFSKAEATAVDKVVVTFSEELALIDIAAFRFNGQAAVAMDVAVVEGKTVATFTLNDAHKLAANYTNNAVQVSYVDATGAGLVKNLFNVSPVHTETKAIADKIAPSVTAVNIVTTSGQVTLTFSEVLNDTISATYAQDLVITKNGTAMVAGVDYQTVVAPGSAIIVVTKVGGADLDDAVYSVKSVATPAFIRDLQANKAVAFTTAKELTVDQTAPTFTATAANGSNTITVVFNEKVNAADAVVLTNYTYTPDKAAPGTTANPTAAVLAADGVTVTLTVAAAVVSANGANDSIIDATVEDLFGNTSVSAPIEF